ncbi:MAG: hypothetical protein ACU83N_02655 [Gammaproteobacteria bacterium]
MKKLTLAFGFMILWLTVSSSTAAGTGETQYFYQKNGTIYRYVVTQTGDNYSFKFETNPGNLDDRFKAGLHVLYSLYHDSSIKAASKQHYIKERADCYALDSLFHTYSLCFLPNEFSSENRQRFWGFVTQMPNWKWLMVYNLFPALLFFGLLFFLTKKNSG